MQDFFQQHFIAVAGLIALAIALTIFVFRKRKFERGYRKGEAANPQKVKEQNRPDEWSRSH
ncbi:MAG TPA: LPXTG cell wall anchor domain-containing protein [Steroidobacter sp.]